MLHVDTNKLRGKMAERRVTQEELARQIGMNAATFYRKMQANGLAFTVGQMHDMVDFLHMSADEATNIFLCNNSQ